MQSDSQESRGVVVQHSPTHRVAFDVLSVDVMEYHEAPVRCRDILMCLVRRRIPHVLDKLERSMMGKLSQGSSGFVRFRPNMPWWW